MFFHFHFYKTMIDTYLYQSRTGFGHVVSDTFLERPVFLFLTVSVALSSETDESRSVFRPRPTFLSSFSEPTDSRFDFLLCRCGG